MPATINGRDLFAAILASGAMASGNGTSGITVTYTQPASAASIVTSAITTTTAQGSARPHVLKVGDAEVTILSDGEFSFPLGFVLPDEERQRLRREAMAQ